MNNLICVFFGHKPDNNHPILNNTDNLFIQNTGIKFCYFKFCKRCRQVFIETIPMEGKRNWLSDL